MTAALPSPAALAAFLRGIDRRAAVLAELQCGDPLAGDAALAAAMRAFRTSAEQLPLAQWPQQFWALLLATPQLRRSAPPSAWTPQWRTLAALGNGPRAAVLLRLAAGLEIEAAAAILAVTPETYLLALQHAASSNAWQSLESAIQQQLQSLSPQRLARLAQLRERALLGQPVTSTSAPMAAPRPRRSSSLRRWPLTLLWLGLAACIAGFAATFFWSYPPGMRGDGALPIHSEALPPAEAPAARFDADFAASSHRDFALLADPDGLRRAQALPLFAWYAVELVKTPVAPAVATTEVVPAIGALLPTQPPTSWTQMDATQRAEYIQSMAAWDALSAVERGAQRERYRAWHALDSVEQAQVNAAARVLASLPEAEQQAVQQQFAALDASTQRGWLLGPDLGADYPKLHPLLAQLPAEQHAPLLVALRVMSAAERADLARLAQRLPPQQRADLLRGLLATPSVDRGAWLRLRLAD